MSTHNIGFYEEIRKIINLLSSNIIKYAPYFCCCKFFLVQVLSQCKHYQRAKICQMLKLQKIMKSMDSGLKKIKAKAYNLSQVIIVNSEEYLKSCGSNMNFLGTQESVKTFNRTKTFSLSETFSRNLYS